METMKFEEASPAEGGANQEGENNINSQAAPKAPRNKKLIWAGIILAVLILSAIGWQYWQYTQSPYYQQIKAVRAIEEWVKESDKWGGKTPEETVRLFTEAVKKGDFELASKYGDREQIFPVLEKMKAEGKINNLIIWLENGEIKMFIGGDDADLKTKENGQDLWILSMHKSDGGTWKIDEF